MVIVVVVEEEDDAGKGTQRKSGDTKDGTVFAAQKLIADRYTIRGKGISATRVHPDRGGHGK